MFLSGVGIRTTPASSGTLRGPSSSLFWKKKKSHVKSVLLFLKCLLEFSNKTITSGRSLLWGILNYGFGFSRG